jgi:hypothetical protein
MATVCSSHQPAERKGAKFREGSFMGSPPEGLKWTTECIYQKNIIFSRQTTNFFLFNSTFISKVFGGIAI